MEFDVRDVLPARPKLRQKSRPETRFNAKFEAFLNAHIAYWNTYECVVLPKVAVNAMRTVANWRKGENAVETILPPGTPLATFMDRDGNPSDFWDGGAGLGITGNYTTHSGVLAGYVLDRGGKVNSLKIWEIYPGCGRVRRRIYPVDDSLFGTSNARSYHAIYDFDHVPLGGKDNPFFEQWLGRKR